MSSALRPTTQVSLHRRHFHSTAKTHVDKQEGVSAPSLNTLRHLLLVPRARPLRLCTSRTSLLCVESMLWKQQDVFASIIATQNLVDRSDASYTPTLMGTMGHVAESCVLGFSLVVTSSSHVDKQSNGIVCLTHNHPSSCHILTLFILLVFKVKKIEHQES